MFEKLQELFADKLDLREGRSNDTMASVILIAVGIVVFTIAVMMWTLG